MSVRYCPKCHARYTFEAAECVTCKVALVDSQPSDEPIIRPLIDVPFVLVAVAFLLAYGRLPGEAQSFGLIFLLVGGLTIVTFRAIARSEWLGRR